MGSEDYDDEKPIHEVHVDGFWLARYPVTNTQYKLFIEAGGYDKQQWWTTEGVAGAAERKVDRATFMG